MTALILASARSHNGKRESFAELIGLFRPTAIVDRSDYDVRHEVQGSGGQPPVEGFASRSAWCSRCLEWFPPCRASGRAVAG